MNTQKGYLRAKNAAQYLDIGLSTLWLFASQGKFTPIKLSDKCTVFAIEELEAFVQSKMAV